MSLINDALKKAAEEAEPGDPLQNSYPEKIFFIPRRGTSRQWRPLLLGLIVVVGGLGAILLYLPNVVAPLTGPGGLFGSAPKEAVAPKQIILPAPSVPSPPPIDTVAVTAQLDAAVDAYHAQAYERARDAFAEVLVLDAQSALAHNGLGLTEQALGNVDEAERQFLTAIRVAPTMGEPHNNLARLYDQQNRTDRAIIEYRRALSLRPDYPEARLNYAIALERSGRLRDARKAYKQFLSEVPPGLDDVARQVESHMLTLSS